MPKPKLALVPVATSRDALARVMSVGTIALRDSGGLPDGTERSPKLLARDRSFVLIEMMIGAREGSWRLVVFLLGATLCGVSVTHYPGGAIPGEAIGHRRREDISFSEV